MVWSLSQDDDGLESVQPPGAPGGSTPPASGFGPSSEPAATTSDRPFSSPNPSPGPKRKAEATLVLAERRLDRLRAEVKRRQRWFAVRRGGAILGWMLAGGAAVGTGVFVARSLSSEGEAASDVSNSQQAAVEAAPAEAMAPAARSAPPTPPGDAETKPIEQAEAKAAPLTSVPEAASAAAGAISLDDLPTRSAVEAKAKPVVRKKSAARR